MAKPPIIANTQPHTVSVPKGSNMATRPVPKPRDDAAPAPPVRPRAKAREGDGAPAAPAPARPDRAAARASARAVLGPEVMERMNQLKQRNDAVRAVLKRLSTPGPTL